MSNVNRVESENDVPSKRFALEYSYFRTRPFIPEQLAFGRGEFAPGRGCNKMKLSISRGIWREKDK